MVTDFDYIKRNHNNGTVLMLDQWSEYEVI